MKISTMVASLAKIVTGENVRLANHYDLDGLTVDIADRGLIEPIKVWNHVDDLFEVIGGHRRLAAIQRIENENPDAFKKHFKKGVPCVVVGEVTAEQVLDLKIDDGNKLIANDPHEIQRAGNFLFRSGKTEAEVANRLRGLIESTTPMKAKVRESLNGLEAALAKATEDGNPQKVTEHQKAIDKMVADYYRGRVQNLHNAYRCPAIVMAALHLKATGGDRLEGFEKDKLPSKLSTANVTTLYKAHEADMQLLGDDNLPLFNKTRPGPKFREKWAAIIESDGKDPKVTPPKAKSMSAKDIIAEVTDGTWRSQGFKVLSQRHAGQEVDMEVLQAADTLLYYVEIVQGHDPKDIDTIVSIGKDYEAAMRDNDEAVTADDQGIDG